MTKDNKDNKKNNNNNNKNKSKKNEIKPITEDSRFKQVHNDPRFKFPNFKSLKIKVDDRFSKKELSKLNNNNNVKIDRYGRKLNKDDLRNKVIDKFIEHEDEDEEEESTSEAEESEEEEEEDEEVSKLEKKIRKEESELDRARGEGMDSDISSSSSDEEEEEDDSSDESDLSLDEDEEEEEESEVEIEENKPQESEPTKSFAVVNMDWDNLRAEDLMATFISFVPKGGSIKSVKIYPSEFGKERMQKEELEGPSREIFKSKRKSKKSENNDSDDDSDSDSDLDSDVDINDAKELERVTKKLYEQDDGKEDYDSKALRRYQLQRLRYFYAVVECDSINTSENIYKNVDGTEYESTANIFDLRYIPDNMEFDENDVKDECFKISKNYRPDSKFVTDALQHSKVKLTWDETPKERLTLSSRPLSQREIEDNDFKAYLASDSENDNDDKDNENNNLKNKYQSLLGNTFSKLNKEENEDEDEDDVDMEITFDPGLKDGKVDSEEEEKEETTIDAYKRKEKERRQRRLNKYKESKEVEEDEEEEISKSKSNKKRDDKKHNRRSKEQNNLTDKQKAELELVLMDNEKQQQNNHFNMKDVLKNEKNLKNTKNKKGNKKIDSEMIQDNFNVDLQDDRFNEIFENHEYAIDPTSSEFKKSNIMNKILKERSIRKNKNDKFNDKSSSKKRKFESNGNKDDYNDVKNLAKKLKNRR
ncbi:ESF1 [Candida pseudojiufengensis]|uniref:ESF1 n=1 Tax=Candida pseudojiufengensis TaxID=497109 RepID=UPI002224A69F|nr:ESF1 [Candida pseudojiufengensis]KAI5963754.1 ESF1 [Candida pseudojiufengensis]